MTPEQIAEKKLLSAEEHGALWDQFYQHASDGCFVDPGHETAMLELIKAQPLYFTVKLDEHTIEHFGMFAWKRHNETIGYVAITAGDGQECCMMDVEPQDVVFYQRRAA